MRGIRRTSAHRLAAPRDRQSGSSGVETRLGGITAGGRSATDTGNGRSDRDTGTVTVGTWVRRLSRPSHSRGPNFGVTPTKDDSAFGSGPNLSGCDVIGEDSVRV